MQFLRLFPLNVAGKGACRVGLLFVWSVVSGLVAFGNGGTNPPPPPPLKPSARPVARLISSSDSNVVSRTRTRLIASTRVGSATSVSPAPVAVGVSATGEENRLIDLINAQRRARGESALVLDGELMRIARLHSQNMARSGVLDHVGTDGLDVVGRARAVGMRGWSALGENIAYNQNFDDPAAFAVERWMLSSKHRDNILDSMFTHTGLGVARSADGRVFFTQVFMTR